MNYYKFLLTSGDAYREVKKLELQLNYLYTPLSYILKDIYDDDVFISRSLSDAVGKVGISVRAFSGYADNSGNRYYFGYFENGTIEINKMIENDKVGLYITENNFYLHSEVDNWFTYPLDLYTLEDALNSFYFDVIHNEEEFTAIQRNERNKEIKKISKQLAEVVNLYKF